MAAVSPVLRTRKIGTKTIHREPNSYINNKKLTYFQKLIWNISPLILFLLCIISDTGNGQGQGLAWACHTHHGPVTLSGSGDHVWIRSE